MAKDEQLTLTGRWVETGDAVAVRVAEGRVSGVDAVNEIDDAALPWIGPGLVDLQVNGFAGVDMNGDRDLPERAGELVDALLGVGVTSFLPTVVTAAADAIESRLRVIASLNDTVERWRTLAAGVHLEGPFISAQDGPRGAHPAAHVRAPDWELFSRWQEAAGGTIRIVTLSPEWPDSGRFISRCREAGVVVAIGHTAATPAQIRDAVSAGATLSTHFGNGAHPVLPRHPNYLWEQLAADELWASVIADGFHLPDAVLKTVFRVKGNRAILVSDSVALAGMPPGEYRSPIGDRVVLTEAGRLHLAADPRLLAGSAQSLIAGISHLLTAGLGTLAEAWMRASAWPADLLGLRCGGLAVGDPADLVTFDLIDGLVRIRQMVKGGRVAEHGGGDVRA